MPDIKELRIVTGLTNPPNTATCINETIKMYLQEGWQVLGEPVIGKIHFQPMTGLTANGSLQAEAVVTFVKYTTHEDQMEAAQKYADELLAQREKTGVTY